MSSLPGIISLTTACGQLSHLWHSSTIRIVLAICRLARTLYRKHRTFFTDFTMNSHSIFNSNSLIVSLPTSLASLIANVAAHSSSLRCYTWFSKHKGKVYCRAAQRVKIPNCPIPNCTSNTEPMKFLQLCTFTLVRSQVLRFGGGKVFAFIICLKHIFLTTPKFGEGTAPECPLVATGLPSPTPLTDFKHPST